MNSITLTVQITDVIVWQESRSGKEAGHVSMQTDHILSDSRTCIIRPALILL